MTLRQLFAALALAVLLTGCGSGPARRVSPSVVTIQELVARDDGQWRLTLRVQNFSTVAMHYESIRATLHIAGADVGTIDINPNLDVPPTSADVVETTLHASAKLPAGDLEYHITGTIESSEPKADFKLDRSSRLSPAPGLPGTWR
ncbi:MAG: hypothetical protein ACREPX_01980 [Rhodanobacteraceae bacterium]